MAFKNKSGEKIHVTDSLSDLSLEADAGLTRMKKALQQGLKPKACQACWKLETAQGVSRRQKMNREHKEILQKIKKDSSCKLPKTVFDFKVGNVCNQKCLICGPAASSLWIKEHSAVYSSTGYLKTKNISQKTLPTLNNSMAEAKEIHISGGEPFLNIVDLEKLLLNSVASGVARHQHLIITTNGSIYPEKLIRDVFPHFKKVQVLMSADGIGPQFDYLRFPAKWPVFFENYLRFKETRFFAGICLTINALNAFNLTDYLQFWDEQGENQVLVNYLNSPEILAVDALPKKIREQIGRKWLEKKFTNRGFEVLMLELFQYLRLSQARTPKQQLNSLHESILSHDNYRKVSFSSIFKEYDALLKQTVL